MLSHVIHEHMVLNIVLWGCSSAMRRSMICLINLSNWNIIPFLLVPLARLNLKTGFFQASWFHRFSWIHYDGKHDSAFCFLCCKVVKGKKMGITRLSEASFLVKGFTNWKDATQILVKHESSNFPQSSNWSTEGNQWCGWLVVRSSSHKKKKNRE